MDQTLLRAGNFVAGKIVVVTGAGGSIGSGLVRQIADLKPAQVVLLDNSEHQLYAIDLELSEQYPELRPQCVLCDVRDRAAVFHWFDAISPEIVFHAAGLKHIPLVEQNPIEGFRTNALGTQNVADAAVQSGVTIMVMISTDKAVRPSSVMGATKRLAEMYCRALDAQGGPTRLVTVRLGNVLGSSGSVIPLFERQIAKGGPVTVTHPNVTRYFMTLDDAVLLAFQAMQLAIESASRRGAVFVRDMGEPQRIAELAARLIQRAGKRPDIDIPIEFIGLRLGEKLHEEILDKLEEQEPTSVSGVLMASQRSLALPVVRGELASIAREAEQFNEANVVRLLKIGTPESCPRTACVSSPAP